MGRTGGGVFNTLLKSGSNEIHGSLFGYTRQTDWLANQFFRNATGQARPDTPYYNWGASFGGPVLIPKVYDGKNKTFFWVTTESYRQKSGLSDGYALPTALERAGDYSQSSVGVFDPLIRDTGPRYRDPSPPRTVNRQLEGLTRFVAARCANLILYQGLATEFS
jgi:hypothetical protein